MEMPKLTIHELTHKAIHCDTGTKIVRKWCICIQTNKKLLNLAQLCVFVIMCVCMRVTTVELMLCCLCVRVRANFSPMFSVQIVSTSTKRVCLHTCLICILFLHNNSASCSHHCWSWSSSFLFGISSCPHSRWVLFQLASSWSRTKPCTFAMSCRHLK